MFHKNVHTLPQTEQKRKLTNHHLIFLQYLLSLSKEFGIEYFISRILVLAIVHLCFL